jgi:hypothetical protein
MPVVHAPPHRDDLVGELLAVARQTQDRLSLGLERGADRGVADEAMSPFAPSGRRRRSVS